MTATTIGGTDRHHERLWSIAGRWVTDGHVVGDPPVPVTGFDTYEILAGGYFLVHHVDVKVGDQDVRAIEIIGEPDPATGGFLARSFDNSGSWEVMQVTVDDNGVFPLRRRPHDRAGGPTGARRHRPGSIDADRQRQRRLDDRPLGTFRGWNHLAAMDAHLVHEDRLTTEPPERL
jgi:hypothetical protein